MTRYVVSLPPAMVNRPLGLSTRRCSREAADGPTCRGGPRKGRRPAPPAMTAAGEERACGEEAVAERKRETTACGVGRSPSGDAPPALAGVPVLLRAPPRR